MNEKRTQIKIKVDRIVVMDSDSEPCTMHPDEFSDVLRPQRRMCESHSRNEWLRASLNERESQLLICQIDYKIIYKINAKAAISDSCVRPYVYLFNAIWSIASTNSKRVLMNWFASMIDDVRAPEMCVETKSNVRPERR